MWNFLLNRVLYWVLRVFLRSLTGAAAGLYTFWILLTMPDRYGGAYPRWDEYPLEYYWISAGMAALVVFFPAQIMEFIASALPKDKTSSMTVQHYRPIATAPPPAPKYNPAAGRGERT